MDAADADRAICAAGAVAGVGAAKSVHRGIPNRQKQDRGARTSQHYKQALEKGEGRIYGFKRV